MKYTYIVCHYGELILKGKNRDFFVQRLVQNIEEKFALTFPDHTPSLQKSWGNIVFTLPESFVGTDEDLYQILAFTPGVANFSFAIGVPNTLDEMSALILDEISNLSFDSFKVATSRADKRFPLTSPEINKEIGAKIFLALKTKKVQLKNPDLTCFLEITQEGNFFYTKKQKGLGGLPIGSSGKAAVLLSGGIDSPVASFFAMKRGLGITAVHFHAEPYTSPASTQKVRTLVEKLTMIQPHIQLFLIPLAPIQREIVDKMS